jgi:predicted nicotinamide N-methyase
MTDDSRALADTLNDDKSFPGAHHKGAFDIILASDVIYFAGCLQPLADCLRHFITPGIGRCLFVNDLARYEVFADRFKVILEEAQLRRILDREIEYEGKMLKVLVI